MGPYFLPPPKSQQPSHEVVANVIQVWRDGVHSASEVEVMGEVKVIDFAEAASDI